ncbi:MAG: L-glyceraldehyde 3-phosphate reductase [Clostridiales bacterium]|jgi:L-glyceraldehyde 3-phosphate reductase|nr:L-glyceraldehyde 3-phosphate reductase [Clostridiales bacterium]
MSYQPASDRYTTLSYNRCGESGLKLPAISLGLWHNFGSDANIDRMKTLLFTAFDRGITHFDIANNYGPYPGAAEENFGRILKSDLRPYRDELLISTKAGYTMWDGPYGDFGSRKYLLSSLDHSLRRMGLEFVDIFYHHRPDPDTPLEETMGALDQAVRSGKALYAGLSNYDGETMRKASAILRELRTPFVINQNSASILNRRIDGNGLRQAVIDEKKGLIIYCPLAQGLLAGRYTNGIPADSRVRTSGRFLKESSITPEVLAKVEALGKLAMARGQTLAQMSLSWLFTREGVTSVLIGASKPEQILENVQLNTAFTADELAEIDRIALS